MPPGELALHATADAGRVGRAGRLLEPAGVRRRRPHRLLALRGDRAGRRPGAGHRRAPRRPPATSATRDRPAPGPYPIFRCRDGHVRLVLLAPRQWHAMRAWLGEPEELQDPELDTIRGRARRRRTGCTPPSSEHFRDRGKHELTLEGQARGVPIAPVLTPADVLAAEHFRARGAIARTELATGLMADAPAGFAEIDGARVRCAGRGARRPASTTTSSSPSRPPPRRDGAVGDAARPGGRWRACASSTSASSWSAPSSAACSATRAPRSSRSRARRSPTARASRRSHFAIGHRGSKSVGVNLRSPEGVDGPQAPDRPLRRAAGELQARHAGEARPRPATSARDQPEARRRQQQRDGRHRSVEHLDGLRPARALQLRADEPLALSRRRGRLRRRHDDPSRPLRRASHARSPRWRR